MKELLMVIIECTTLDQRTSMNRTLDSSSTSHLPTVSWDATQFQVELSPSAWRAKVVEDATTIWNGICGTSCNSMTNEED